MANPNKRCPLCGRRHNPGKPCTAPVKEVTTTEAAPESISSTVTEVPAPVAEGGVTQ